MHPGLARAAIFAIAACAMAGIPACAPAAEEPAADEQPPLQPAAEILGLSTTLSVAGRFEPVTLDSVDGVAIEGGRLILRGSSTSVGVDLPPSADTAKPVRNWALTTEGTGERGRTFTFINGESLQDFTVELPPGDAPLKFGVFSQRAISGEPPPGDVMVFAWGSASRSYWGYVTIAKKAE